MIIIVKITFPEERQKMNIIDELDDLVVNQESVGMI